MSGGFFRGTSTDQDTRFSNKKAKLLKSQKFASELETLVDMTKVKIDVMRPWIAKRVTELIGFEDEVLINFIYGLLEGKEVNGKEIQISLTGFMERNTGKFMKELWLLLLSAQQNVSGVPQQFLDAKEEETKQKKAETDRIANEIQRKKEKEKQELEHDRVRKDADDEKLNNKFASLEQNPLPDYSVSNNQQVYEKNWKEKRHPYARSRDSKSPDLAYRSSSPRKRNSTPPTKSFSKSRSDPDEKGSSRSVSRSPLRRGRSISSERRYPTLKQSLSPRRNRAQVSPSPPRHGSSRSYRRSLSPRSRRISPSIRHRERFPRRHDSRSPFRHRSRSPRERSRTPVRTSSLRRRSPSPLRRSSSSSRYRSPSPVRRRRSPLPLRRRRSPYPMRRRSPSPINRWSQSPVRRRSPPYVRRRSPSLSSDRSRSPRYHKSRSPLRRKPPSRRRYSPSPPSRRYHRSPSTPRRSVSPGYRKSSMLGGKRSLTQTSERTPPKLSSSPPNRHSSISPVRRKFPERMRSPSPSPAERVRNSEIQSPIPAKNQNVLKLERPIISLRSPQRDFLDRDNLHGKRSTSPPSKQKSPSELDALREISDGEAHSGRDSDRSNHRGHQKKPESAAHKISARSEKESALYSSEAGSKNIARANDGKGGLSPEPGALPQLNGRNCSIDSRSLEIDDCKDDPKEKRKHKRSHRHETKSDDSTSDDSYEEKKESKRRRKEEKKLKREERRRKRKDEHRKRKEERRAERRKGKSGSESDDDQRQRVRKIENQNVKSAQKDLEMELREKALESLRAKKGIDNSKK